MNRLNLGRRSMLAQATSAKFIDFWSIMPQIEKSAKRSFASGHLKFGKTIELEQQSAKSSAINFFHAYFSYPNNSSDFASCEFIFLGEDYRNFLILCLGAPTGLGGYKWRGICPVSLTQRQILHFDEQLGFFVSAKSIGRAAPESSKRIEDLDIVFNKIYQKYSAIDWSKPGSYPNIAGDPDFQPFNSVLEIIADRIAAGNGLPRLVTGANNKTDVIATINQSLCRARLPRSSLIEITLANITYKTREEVLAQMKERRLPIPHGWNFIKE